MEYDFSLSRCRDGYHLEERQDGSYIVPVSASSERWDPREAGLSIFRNLVAAPATPDGALAYTNRFGMLLDERELAVKEWLTHRLYMAEAFGKAEVGDWVGLQIDLGRYPLGQMSTGIHSEPDEPWAMRLVLKPRSLVQMAWVEFVLLITSEAQFRQCDMCGAWFAYGSGTNRRSSARFCGPACRKANHVAEKGV